VVESAGREGAVSIVGLLQKLFGPPDHDGFARLLTRAIRAAGVTDSIEYDPAEFKLTIGGSGHHVLFMSNAYADYLSARRRDRPGILRKYASLTQMENDEDQEESFDEIKVKLLPRIQSRYYHDLARMAVAELPASPSATGPDTFERRAFTEHLALDLVCDHPQAIQTVTAKALARWGTTFDAALAVAKENLWRLSNERWEEVAPGVHLSPWRDTHDASRLFLHDLIWQLPVKGEHVAMAPNRVMLFVTGSEDEAGLLALAALAEEALEVDRSISGVAL
jgi:hypothetical protein